MATIRQRKEGNWQAIIRRQGFPDQAKTFQRRDDADAWARKVESEMERGQWRDSSEADTMTLSDALARYALEVTPRKKGAKREADRIKAWQGRKIAASALSRIRGADVASFRNSERKRGLAEASIRLEIALLSHLFETARREWGMETLVNPCKLITLPGGSKARERRLQGNEETRLLDAIGKAMPRTHCASALIRVAIETGMRQGELLALVWTDLNLKARVLKIREAKSGEGRDVPLSSAAVAAFQSLPRPIDSGRVFSIQQDRLIRGFKKACVMARIENLKFHDLRHEAASRLSSVFNAAELAKVMGWKTIQMAMRYCHPRATDLAKKLA